LLSFVLVAAPAIHAETLYVIDQLVVNVNSAPDASGARVATIKSGESVEVLERQGDQVHVRLPNGTEGWVRKSYLSPEEPVQHRLTERTAENEKLKQDVARLEGELAAARAGNRAGKGGAAQTNTAQANGPQVNTSPAARAAAAAPGTKVPSATAAATGALPATPAETNTVGTTVDPAAGEPAYFMTPPEGPARPVWHWALASFVVALGLGYALGWYVLDRRIRRKYGGLRIY